MTPFRAALAAAVCLWGGACGALTLELPAGARLAASAAEPQGVVGLPLGPWKDGEPDRLRAEGAVSLQAWQLETPGLTLAQIDAPLRAQLLSEGYEILYDCDARACGGFEFRYGLDVLPEPEMHVDLGAYHYLVAEKPDDTEAPVVSLLVSRTEGRGFVQITRVEPVAPDAAPAEGVSVAPEVAGAVASRAETPAADTEADLATQLATQGRAVLDGLSFVSGSSNLAEGTYPSLTALAQYLTDNPEARVVLVGHTDAEGALAGNIALSRQRAQAVAARLAETHGVARGRMDAEGVGFLAPRASNATEDGRQTNRRVEVVLETPQP